MNNSKPKILAACLGLLFCAPELWAADEASPPPPPPPPRKNRPKATRSMPSPCAAGG